MTKRRYVPSGVAPLTGILAVGAAACGAGMLTGALEGFVSQWISLLLIFPAAVGFAAGIAGATAVEMARVRGPLVAALLGALGASAGQLTEHAVEMANMRSAMGAALASEGIPASQLDDLLEEETGSRGVAALLAMRVGVGVSIGRRGSGLEITGKWVILFWLAELAVAAGIGAAMTYGAASQPFCEGCQRWYRPKVPVLLGGAGEADVMTRALENGDWGAAVRCAGQPSADAVTTVSLRRCEGCLEHEPILSVEVTTAADTNKPQTASRYETLVTPAEASDLLQAIARAAPA